MTESIRFLRSFRLVERRILPSGKRLRSHGKSPFLMGKSTISMAIFNCYVSSPEGRVFHGVPVTSLQTNLPRLRLNDLRKKKRSLQ